MQKRQKLVFLVLKILEAKVIRESKVLPWSQSYRNFYIKCIAILYPSTILKTLPKSEGLLSKSGKEKHGAWFYFQQVVLE